MRGGVRNIKFIFTYSGYDDYPCRGAGKEVLKSIEDLCNDDARLIINQLLSHYGSCVGLSEIVCANCPNRKDRAETSQ